MRTAVAVLCVAAFLFAACGRDTEVGSERLREFEEQESPGRIGAIEREESPEPSPPPPSPTAEAKPSPSPSPLVPTLNVEINAQGYKPFNFRVFVGTKVRVTNADSQARTFTADKGEFDSGPIAPGASYTYTATKAGVFNFHDETRPFVVGQMEVVQR